jgi:hypothetical protein
VNHTKEKKVERVGLAATLGDFHPQQAEADGRLFVL